MTIAATVALATVTIAPVGAGATTVRNGRIAYERDFQGGVQVFKMAPNGAVRVRLTGLGQNYEPSWSPNGRTIAFVGERSGGSQLFLMGAAGSNQRVVNTGPPCVAYPSWSPDGRRLVFARWADAQCNGAPDLWTVRTDGTQLKQLTNTPVDREVVPKWSPDGSRIAFANHTNTPGTFAVFTVRADGTDRRRVTPASLDASYPDWSPDGSTLAVTSGADQGQESIYTVQANGQHLTRLTRRTPDVINFQPTWSPDGAQVLFSSNRNGDEYDLYTVRLRDRVVRRRTRTGANEYGSTWQAVGA